CSSDLEAVGHEVGVKGEAEKALLSAARYERADVEERRRQHCRAVVDQDAPGLLDDEEAARAVTGVGGANGTPETPGDRFEAEGDLRRGTAARPHARRRGDEERHRRVGLHPSPPPRSEEHTSELQSLAYL